MRGAKEELNGNEPVDSETNPQTETFDGANKREILSFLQSLLSMFPCVTSESITSLPEPEGNM